MDRLPPFPTGDLRVWANQLVEYLQQREGIGSEVLPTSISLQHRIDDSAKAIQDGILMYDPVLSKPLVSISGAWVPIAIDIATTYRATVSTLVLTDAWQDITSTFPSTFDDGTYQLILYLKLTGTGGAAEWQIRVTSNGVPVVTGAVNSIGNGETEYIALDFIISATGDPLQLEARGINATLEDGSGTAVRLGQ